MTSLPEGFVRVGAHIWSPTERQIYERTLVYGPTGTGDELRFSSHRYHFWVIPMVQALDNASFNEPRRPWHVSKARRPRYWAVAKTPSKLGPAAIWMDSWAFKTQAEAIKKAKELAHHDKVMDLLEAN